MQLSTSQIYQQAVTSMLDKQTALAKTQQQLATGQKILAPSDDPGAATRILNLTQMIETTDQYQRNADFAETRLALEEAVLTDIGDMLQRVRGLAVQANNATNTAQDRKIIAIEVRESLDSLLQLSNSKDANGEYLFSGFKTDTEPFSDAGAGTFIYAGDQGQRSLQVGPKRQVVTGDSGFDVFLKVDNGAGGVSSMFNALYDFANDLESNISSTSTISRMDSALESVTNTRAKVGSRMNMVDNQRNANDGFSLVLKENRSSLEDLDYAAAVSLFQQQQLALQASQQSFVKISGLSLFNFL